MMRKALKTAIVGLLAGGLVACGGGDGKSGDPAPSNNTPNNTANNTPNNETQSQSLTPAFTIGQTWVVASIYRSTSVKTPEDALSVPSAVEAELSAGAADIEIEPLMPAEVVPVDGSNWTSPVFWRFGVVNTDYVPEDGAFAELATDTSGQVQPITIIKAVAPKELNDRGIADGLDPVFYLVLRQSDWSVRGVHYNYKVREGRNTVVLEMPEGEGDRNPGADLDYFLVDYLMPAFPLQAEDATIAYGAEGAGLEMHVLKKADDSAEVAFKSAIDRKDVTQRWSAGEPWFDWSVTESRRSWRVGEAALLELLEANGVDFYTNDQFLEQAEAIDAKFRNRYNVRQSLTVSAGAISSRTPDSQLPWAGYWFPLSDSGTTFGWSNTSGRRLLSDGPATSLKADLVEDLTAIDNLMDEILEMPRDAEGRDDKVKEYWDKKNAVAETVRNHFEDPETGVIAKLKRGEMSLEQVNSFGPLEKFGLMLMANKTTDRPFEAAIWEMTKQYNPAGGSWWGKCNGWAAASILTNEPREDVTVQLDLANLTGEEGTLNMDFTAGDLKSLAASSYYGTRSHFYGQRYYGEDDDRGADYQDIHADVFHRLITFYIGEEKFPMVFDLTAGDQVWNYSCYAYNAEIGEIVTLDEGTQGINLVSAKILEEEGGISAEAAEAIFKRVRGPRAAFAKWSEVSELEAVSEEDVTKLQGANFSLWGERRAHQVATELKCATDGVGEDHLDTPGADPQGFSKNYTYNLVVSETGTILRGEWTGASIDEHPDFAWVPYANEVRRSDANEWRRHGSYESYLRHVYWSRYAPSENVFLFTDVTDTLLDVRVNAPVVCNVAPDDCGPGLICNGVDGVCIPAPEPEEDEPAPADGCIGGADKTQPASEVSDGRVCAGRDSWFAIELEEGQKIEIGLTFVHQDGDIDAELLSPTGARLDNSTSTADAESLSATAPATGTHLLRVYGYSGAENNVEISVSVTDAAPIDDTCEEASEPNNNTASATPLSTGEGLEAALCGGDTDFFRIDKEDAWTVTVTFNHSAGDIDVRALDTEGNQTVVSQSTTDVETVTGEGPAFIEVYGYNGATGAYTITMN